MFFASGFQFCLSEYLLNLKLEIFLETVADFNWIRLLGYIENSEKSNQGC